MRQFISINPDLVKSWENLKEHLINTMPIKSKTLWNQNLVEIFIIIKLLTNTLSWNTIG